MFDPRKYIERLEMAEVDLLAEILTEPSFEEEKCLRAYLGNQTYQRLHSLVVSSGLAGHGPDRNRAGNVVIVPDFACTALSIVDPQGHQEQIWFNIDRCMAGDLMLLRMSTDGRHDATPGYEVRTMGLMKQYYGDLMLSLAGSWNVYTFRYNWRRDIRYIAADLLTRVTSWFGEDEVVHFVAHGMGGLVVRAAFNRNPTLLGPNRRLIMLGTPNQGSYLTLQWLVGQAEGLRWLADLDRRHTVSHYLEVLSTFVSLYQMLPAPRDKATARLYEARTYGDKSPLLQHHLTAARKFHKEMTAAVDERFMVNVLGVGHLTPVGLDLEAWRREEKSAPAAPLFDLDFSGDGNISPQMGILAGLSTNYYATSSSLSLPRNQMLLQALDELLETGETTLLCQEPPDLPATGREQDPADYLQRMYKLATAELQMAQRQRQRALPVEDDSAHQIVVEDRQIRHLLSRSLRLITTEETTEKSVAVPFDMASIWIQLVAGDLTVIDKLVEPDFVSAQLQVDALAVGHYQGEMPRSALLKLDQAITAHLQTRRKGKQVVAAEEAYMAAQSEGAAAYATQESREAAAVPLRDGLITQYVRRGIVRSELAQPFLLVDPRSDTNDRVVAIVGKGAPGTFGLPELKVAVRELCWALGQMGKKHLVTVLIGGGRALSAAEATLAWIGGIKYAITGVDPQHRLQTITFVAYDPDKIPEIDRVLRDESARLKKDNRLDIHYTPVAPETMRALQMRKIEQERETLEQRLVELRRAAEQHAQSSAGEAEIQVRGSDHDHAHHSEQRVARINISIDGSTYCFGALTPDASIPEREIVLDPHLVAQANQEIISERRPARQRELGQLLDKLLIPEDLRSAFARDLPLVLMLDHEAARIHWELLAQSQMDVSETEWDLFLSVGRGLTRQLRTSFASPPGPPPPPRRVMRVLIVADPAADARLPGAEEEGILVADLFERFNRVWASCHNRVEVVKLLGPHEATRIRVLQELMMRSYDVLHFAGHCVFVDGDPSASGWIFSNGEHLSAHELRRIDRVPKFIFSNACESGVMSSHPANRSAGLAPSFAESFFERGVSNFVCTAWPVNDLAARRFALTLYSFLLGMREQGDSPRWRERWQRVRPGCMYQAMRAARRSIADDVDGILTWGAYQHYGDPYFQLFDPDHMDADHD